MNINEFLGKLIESQALSDERLKDLSSHREEVEGYLREKYGEEPTIRYAGSKAKGTMIAESYDLDMTCYFPSTNESTLKEIHDSVEKTISKQYLVERKASAVRIKKVDNNVETDYHIDVVPGRFVDGKKGDVFLHVVYGEKERMQTNIDTHITYVKDSGCQDIIKLTKLWKVRNKIPLKTFVFEIAIVEALKGSKSKEDFSKSLRVVFEQFRDEIQKVKLVDPANTNNIVSEAVSSAEKGVIAAKAGEALKILEDNKEDEILGWKKVFNEATSDDVGKSFSGSGGFVPRSPWCAGYVDDRR